MPGQWKKHICVLPPSRPKELFGMPLYPVAHCTSQSPLLRVE